MWEGLSMINVVYLAWNRKEFTELSLASIERHTDWDAVNKFLLLDDFSEDGTWEVCQEWAQGKAKVEVIRRHNPTMSTGEPFAWAGERMGGDCWTLLVPNDCGFCEDVFGAFDRLAKDDADALNSWTLCHAPDDPEHWNQERRTPRMGAVRAGLVAIAPGLLHAIHEQFVITTEGGCSTRNIFRRILPGARIPVRMRRVIPPMRCVFFDHDLSMPNVLPTAIVVAALHSVGMNPTRALELTAEYCAKGWGRLRAAPDGKRAERAGLELDREAHRWVPKKERRCENPDHGWLRLPGPPRR